MEYEHKRGEVDPVPDNLMKFLNEDQIIAYHGVERFGWYIKFIRRPLFQRSICVLSNPEGSRLAVLEEDGSIDEDPGIQFRG
ncbi:MAG TPA: hypothetical protein ENH39_08745 [Gammaproteobacteria bacterium]|nr:hypothetical protein [Gammaproteobacteria bacterium]